MSWFKRRPRTKEPEKKTPQLTSPMSRKILKKQKEEITKKPDQNS